VFVVIVGVALVCIINVGFVHEVAVPSLMGSDLLSLNSAAFHHQANINNSSLP